jgi:hypothetical protein
MDQALVDAPLGSNVIVAGDRYYSRVQELRGALHE